ncbi:CDP-alcohol phosphatidyltransferase family protein [Fodinisporobacter ferrooxydans]|uniref:CDP-alcohol phosphatidyltransferase family protein n=1 Tax=Fodinisporobacter ferrooxydans TaxID=2901836 RepID=A0ABY4CEK2_9BACL|nr:CDP-alcohol phosphatidyltransferase family protein [Alicyclobacillaceae bacterium MYW30-H2]
MKTNRPTLFLDSEMIKKLRKEVQRPWEKDEFWMFYVMRKFSIYISYPLVKKTDISPNALTIIGILLGLISAASYMIGSPFSLLLGCLFYQMCYFFDCIDGEVARLRKKSSKGGEWLDIGLNYAMALCNIAVVFGMFQSDSSFILGIILFAMFIITFSMILSSEGALLVFHQSASTATVSMRKKNKWTDLFVFLFMTDIGFHCGILLFSWIWLFWGFKEPLLLWIVYYIFISFMKAIYKLKASIRYME